MNCKNQKFGHNFLYPNSDCTICGVNQLDLAIDKKITKAYNGGKIIKAQSPRGLLFQELIEFFGIKDKKKFFYQTLRYSSSQIYPIFSEIKDMANCGKLKGNGVGLFFWKLKN